MVLETECFALMPLFLFLIPQMADFDDGEEVAPMHTPVVEAPELPEIKLFGKWSLDDVQLSDMSLQVLRSIIVLTSSFTC